MRGINLAIAELQSVSFAITVLLLEVSHCLLLKKLARMKGFEPSVSSVTGRRIRPLCYTRVFGAGYGLTQHPH